MRKALIMCILAISITLMVNVKAYADEEPTASPSPTPTSIPYQVLNVNVTNVDLNSAYYYYNSVLTSDQKMICAYLIGAYNYMYLKARGFEYDNISDSDDLLDRLVEFGTKFFSNGFKNASRYNSSFQRYLVSIINYSGTINIQFLDWVNSQTDEFYIPFSVEGLNAWTDFYNDPSTDGIINFGYEESPWVSGIFYNFEYSNYNWSYASEMSRWNSEILDYSPGIYTNVYQRWNQDRQSFVSLSNTRIIDTLYILREEGGYRYYRYGYSDKTYPSGYVTIDPYAPTVYLDNGKLRYTNDSFNWNGVINNYGSKISFTELVQYCFDQTPLVNGNNIRGFYPYITHVILVDDLTTLANAVEVTNADNLEIAGENAHWIKTPNGQVLLFPGKPSAVYELDPDRLEDLLVKPDPEGSGNLVPIDPDKDIMPQIVNNTVINNYDIVAPGVIINVPIDWFDSEGNYLDYTYNFSLPFFAFIGDVFLSLGELRVFLLAGVILLICGGVIGKFLL